MSEMLDEELIATRILNGSMSRKEIVEYVNKLQKQLQVEKNTSKNLSKECQKYFDAGMDMQQEIANLKEAISKERKLAEAQMEYEYNQKIKALRDELIGDRMEQFDDYVIYLQDKYLKLLGEEE